MTLTAPVEHRTAVEAPAARLSFLRVVSSEAIKLVSLRSTWWSIAVAAVLSVGISLLMAAASADFGPGFPPVMAVVAPLQFTMLVAGILGAIAVTGEYSTGMIRSTLTAVPRRGIVLAAKALVMAAFMAVSSALIFAIASVATAPLLATPIEWTDAESSLIPVGYAVLSMMVFALLGVGFGFIIRSGAGAIAATVGVLFVAPIVVSLFSMFGEGWAWVTDLGQYLPTNASQTLTSVGAEDTLPALLALLGWAAVALLGAWAVLRTRDA
ncbi:MAG: ABC transporter permease [Candidatus Microbacterium phytovorans]|uniref:ABC transporter permease n=1 Tax=Candidatus Microbacterium phytovorans TaxID=3121374 RepID=A0AAJ5W1Q3_9MICO|nr:ABC transporter permease [Microbacterium sp.]WEK14486.1 MAG: ABC transporter permease [Microbacterium sp.]